MTHTLTALHTHDYASQAARILATAGAAAAVRYLERVTAHSAPPTAEPTELDPRGHDDEPGEPTNKIIRAFHCVAYYTAGHAVNGGQLA